MTKGYNTPSFRQQRTSWQDEEIRRSREWESREIAKARAWEARELRLAREWEARELRLAREWEDTQMSVAPKPKSLPLTEPEVWENVTMAKKKTTTTENHQDAALPEAEVEAVQVQETENPPISEAPQVPVRRAVPVSDIRKVARPTRRGRFRCCG